MRFDDSTRVYIAGCAGMLGDAVYRLLSSTSVVKATDIVVNEPWLEYADVRDYDGMRRSIEEFKPDVIINLAALTDLEQCEREPENTWLTNSLGAENLGLLATKLNVPYVFISTAGIFGGEQDVYTDFDEPRPLSHYAKSKVYAERYVQQAVPKSLILRAGWMMGGGPGKDKKFVNKIYKQIAAGASALHVVVDKKGTPTYTVDFARGMKTLLEHELYGLYNQVCGGGGSRFDVAVEFVRLLGLERTVRVERVESDYYAQEYFAARPASESLVNLKLTRRGLNGMRDWKVCLTEYSRVFLDALRSAGRLAPPPPPAPDR